MDRISERASQTRRAHQQSNLRPTRTSARGIQNVAVHYNMSPVIGALVVVLVIYLVSRRRGPWR